MVKILKYLKYMFTLILTKKNVICQQNFYYDSLEFWLPFLGYHYIDCFSVHSNVCCVYLASVYMLDRSGVRVFMFFFFFWTTSFHVKTIYMGSFYYFLSLSVLICIYIRSEWFKRIGCGCWCRNLWMRMVAVSNVM